MKTISLKVSDPLHAELTAAARRQGVSKSALIRKALETYVRDRSPREGSALPLAGNLAGVVAGPEDLSVNEDHLQRFGD